MVKSRQRTWLKTFFILFHILQMKLKLSLNILKAYRAFFGRNIKPGERTSMLSLSKSWARSLSHPLPLGFVKVIIISRIYGNCYWFHSNIRRDSLFSNYIKTSSWDVSSLFCIDLVVDSNILQRYHLLNYKLACHLIFSMPTLKKCCSSIKVIN